MKSTLPKNSAFYSSNLPGAPPPYPGEEVPTTSHLPSNSSRSNALPDPDAKIRQRLENLKKENGLGMVAKFKIFYAGKKYANIVYIGLVEFFNNK